MSRTIAVTGGTGFVGGAVMRALSRTGQPLRALARDPAKLVDAAPGAEVMAGDLADSAALERLVRQADTVVHIAGAVAARDRQTFHHINADATLRLAELSAAAGVGKFIFVSSLAAREPQLSDYAASKQAAEKGLLALETAMAVTILRPPAVYGPGDKATLPLIDQLSRRHGIIPAAPDGRFSLIHADDLAAAIAALSITEETIGAGPFELDDGQPGGYSWPQLAGLAAGVTGHALKLHFVPRGIVGAAARAVQAKAALTGGTEILTPGKVRELYHRDWSARSNLLQDSGIWQPRIGFAEGFAGTLKWYRDQGWLPPPHAGTKSTHNRLSGDHRS